VLVNLPLDLEGEAAIAHGRISVRATITMPMTTITMATVRNQLLTTVASPG
jgi:hypothetical protein